MIKIILISKLERKYLTSLHFPANNEWKATIFIKQKLSLFYILPRENNFYDPVKIKIFLRRILPPSEEKTLGSDLCIFNCKVF